MWELFTQVLDFMNYRIKLWRRERIPIICPCILCPHTIANTKLILLFLREITRLPIKTKISCILHLLKKGNCFLTLVESCVMFACFSNSTTTLGLYRALSTENFKFFSQQTEFWYCWVKNYSYSLQSSLCLKLCCMW